MGNLNINIGNLRSKYSIEVLNLNNFRLQLLPEKKFKLYLYSGNTALEEFFEMTGQHHFEIIRVKNASDLYQYDDEKCVIMIDIDTLKDHGFVLASRLSINTKRKALIVGITTLDVDTQDSQFNIFFKSFKEVIEKFDLIIKEYDCL